MNYNFLRNKKVLVTGHTGFKGSWMICWLNMLGANILGISLKPEKKSHFNLIKNKINIKNEFIDIRNKKKIEKEILKFKPDFVFHLAAQAIVSKSYLDPKYTFETNVLGTLNIIQSLHKLQNNCNAVFITSDKCYENVEKKTGYRETDRLGGDDFYSSSKASAELIINSYFKSFLKNKKTKLKIVTARAGNVIGGGDWSKDRLVPDCINSWNLGKKVTIRNPDSTRPWQHVLEAINGYFFLAYNLQKKDLSGESFNFSNNKIKNFTVKDFIIELSKNWKNASWKFKKNKDFKETNLLQLNNIKAQKKLKWKNKLKLIETIEMVGNWYSELYKSNNKNIITFKQIKYFINK